MATKFERKMIKPQFYIGKNKNVDIKFSAHDAFLENLHRVRSKSKYWEAK